MVLSKRLKKMVSIYEQNKKTVIADIGTDHGYLPIYLTEKKYCKKAIATDISKESLAKAEKNIKENNLSTEIETKLGDGLSPIVDSGCKMAFIAGMGANLIRDILEKDKEVFKVLDYIIAMPAQNPEVLRQYLYEDGHRILKEDLVFDEKYYEIFVFKYNGVKISKYSLEYEFSKEYLKNPLGYSYFLNLKNNYILIEKKILENINENTIKKSKEIRKKIGFIERRLRAWN